MVLMALVLVLVIAFAGLALDAGEYYKQEGAMQTVADAAALSGAAVLPVNPAGAADRARDIIGANGMDPAEFTIDTYYKSRPDQIEVRANRQLHTLFIRIVGVDSVPIAVRAAARRAVPHAFDFALFAGSETQPLRLSGNNSVDGGTHGNADIVVSGNNHLGAVEAAGETSLTGNNQTGQVTNGVPTLPTPGFDFAGLSQGATMVYSGDQTFSGDMNVSGIVVVHGNVSLSGNLTFNGTLLVDGNVTITGNTTHVFTGQAAVVAAGDINILGNAHLVYDQPRSGGGTAALALVSSGGNITIGGNAEIDGIVYAPSTAAGTGTISLQGNAEIEGAVIGNVVSAAGNVEIDYDEAALVAIPPTTRDRARLIE
ncbi:MAG: DUF7305 domain-containing protein [Symbiobacteriia bacterium]